MKMNIGQQLRACGRKNVPDQIVWKGKVYTRVCVFKHDFFAATSLYRPEETAEETGEKDQIVLKLGRCADFLGVPLTWLGEMLARHESGILSHIAGEPSVPQLLGRYGRTGLIYRYIEGQTLAENPALPEDFFEELSNLLVRIHRYRVAYVDMNKKGNILLGADGKPKMIDFQISCRIPQRILGSAEWADVILDILQKEDFYHLSKHRYRFCGDKQQRRRLRQSRQVSPWIFWHRRLTRPLTVLRRTVLGYLFRTGRLKQDDVSERNSETDPRRWDR